MRYAEFASIARSLTERAERNPKRYRLRVAAFAALGYVYLVGVILGLLLLSLLAGAIVLSGSAYLGVKLLVVLLVPMGAIAKSLWVRVPAPSGGVEVEESAAPGLFELIETLRRESGAPRVHRVRLTPELNAAIVQAPRLGILGWYRNHLIVGLPLLQALSPDEFKAVLAHELGHLSGEHGRFGAWVYRKRRTWAQLAEAFPDDNWLVGRFLAWYVPHFNANSFVLARQHEYEADEAAASAAGRRTAMDALIRIELVGRYLNDRFWPRLEAGASDDPDPPRDPFRRQRRAVREGPSADDASRWLAAALKRPTGYGDTHPALADRLRSLRGDEGGGDVPAGVPEPIGARSAAEAYLGDLEDRVELHFDQQWVLGVREQWRARHEALLAARARVTELDAAFGALSPEEQWERVCLAQDLGQTEEAVGMAMALVAREPSHAGAHLFVGRALLDEDDPSGVSYVERAMELDGGAAAFGRRVLFDFHWRHGERDEAERHLAEYETLAEAAKRAERERGRIDRSIDLRPPELPEERVAALRRHLEEFSGLARVYLCRRLLRHAPEQPVHLVGIQPRRFRFGFEAQTLLGRIVEEAPVGPDVYFVALTGDFRWLKRKMKKIDGSRLL